MYNTPMKKITALICFCFLALQNKNLGYAPQLSADTLADIKGSTNPACLDTYGYILSRLGRLPEATKYLENAVFNGRHTPER